MNAADVKAMAKDFGADLVGIASMDRFESLPPEQNPAQIFPEAKAVIVIGRRILRGALRGVEEGTNFGSTYNTFGFRWLEDNFISKTSYDLTCAMEEAGFEAVPLFGYAPDGMPTGQPVAPGKPAPNVIVDVDFAAQAAGLGELGLGGFFITKEYGTRQRFSLIITDAELEADPVSDKTICGDCQACVEACPLGAISVEDATDQGVPGHTMKVAKIDYTVCRSCANGMAMGPGRGSRPDRCGAACARACLVQLESKGKLTNTFTNEFRKRTPWAMDAYRRPVEVSSTVGKYGCDDVTGRQE